MWLGGHRFEPWNQPFAKKCKVRLSALDPQSGPSPSMDPMHSGSFKHQVYPARWQELITPYRDFLGFSINKGCKLLLEGAKHSTRILETIQREGISKEIEFVGFKESNSLSFQEIKVESLLPASKGKILVSDSFSSMINMFLCFYYIKTLWLSKGTGEFLGSINNTVGSWV